MLPPQVTLIPLYVLFLKLGWLNTFLPLIVPAWFGGGALNIFLMRQFFLQIPHELDEAAIIDGAGHFTIWWRIYMPLSKPVLITVALLSTLLIWNDFFGPLIYLSSPDNYTLALGLNLFQGLFVIAHRLHHGHLDPDGAADDPDVRARPALHRAGVHLERPQGIGQRRRPSGHVCGQRPDDGARRRRMSRTRCGSAGHPGGLRRSTPR